ncbi:ATP-binding cassette domain-containing protein [Desulfosarcina sp. OttesenSCG-928-A07]|nr:ATP-binding cassette domain-containing protein [Desulfosarcina sp. OttesenSCG-928-G17]MDL2328863.1 ATP-binding cassette domain-containing protein [Desulfosarcina sp. OttesenSCG-928-A07]
MTPGTNVPLLQVAHLSMNFPLYGGILRRQTGRVHAVEDVSLTVAAGKTLGLVGESGCGKTTVGRCITRLYKPTAGEVIFEGVDLLKADPRHLRRCRRDLQMIFQDPFESLNARQTVEEILMEPFAIHRVGSPKERRDRVRELLSQVGLSPDAALRYPHEFSGGQRQRIGIARAIALRPKLIICDEPVSALDVSIQSQILNLLVSLQDAMGLGFLFIAHDLAVVNHVSDVIAVMYLGRIVEMADAQTLYAHPLHPYTQALIAAIPEPSPKKPSGRFAVLPGEVPSPIHPPDGCHFHQRCSRAKARCREESPPLVTVTENKNSPHQVACFFI